MVVVMLGFDDCGRGTTVAAVLMLNLVGIISDGGNHSFLCDNFLLFDLIASFFGRSFVLGTAWGKLENSES